MDAEISSSSSVAMPAYHDPRLDEETRITALLSELTTEEKIACLGTDIAVPRLGIRGTGHVEGLHGLALGGPKLLGGDHPIATTTFPQAVGLACTWDEACLTEAAAIVAHEARYYFQSNSFRRGGLVVRAPNAGLARDPRWGRTEESYGEDAYLAGRLAAAYVRGLQGNHPRYWLTAAMVSHFLANGNEDARETSSSDFDDRLLHEYYAAPFRHAMKAGGARCLMTALNKYNGIPCTTHPALKEVAVAGWGQDGITCADARAFGLLITAHRQFQSRELAAAATIDAGISQFQENVTDGLDAALQKRLLCEDDLNDVLRKNLRVLIRLGLLDPPDLVPFVEIGNDREEPWQREVHQEAVRSVTQKSIVLLKNTNNLLPLDPAKLRRVAVIGPLADRVLADSHSGTMPYAVSPVDGLRERLGLDRVALSSNNDPSEAVILARSADLAIVCVGNHPTGDQESAQVTRPSYGKEAVDRKSLELEDEALVKRVLLANPQTIVVLISSFPYAIVWTAEHVPAILHMSHNSQELGRALADVLFGDCSPAGRLVHTWPRSTADLTPIRNYDLRKGNTYQYAKSKPLFPFGFGLSYTRFAYSRLQTSAVGIDRYSPITVSCDVTNIGPTSGDEVVQFYVSHLESHVARPRQILAGFFRTEIAPGETKTVTFELQPEQIMYWDVQADDWVMEPGPIEVRIGRSSEQIELLCTIEAR